MLGWWVFAVGIAAVDVAVVSYVEWVLGGRVMGNGCAGASRVADSATCRDKRRRRRNSSTQAAQYL